MAYHKTDGTLQDMEYIVNRLKEGFSFDEAIQGMKMPLDPGTPERPGWCYRNKQLFLDLASGKKVFQQPGLTKPAKRPVGFVTTNDGKVWAIYADQTRSEVKPVDDKPIEVPVEQVQAESLPMAEENIPKEVKRSRRKAAQKPKEW